MPSLKGPSALQDVRISQLIASGQEGLTSSPTMKRASRGEAKVTFWKPYGPYDPNGEYTDESTVAVKQFGQDGVGFADRTVEGNSFSCTMNADGHGVQGQEHTKYALHLAPQFYSERHGEVLKLVTVASGGNQRVLMLASDKIRTIMTEVIESLDIHIRNNCSYTRDLKSGGCTFTFNVQFPNPIKPWLVTSITSNVGDSFQWKYHDGELEEQTREWNCEGLDEWSSWVKLCSEKGVEPGTAYLGRFNTDGSMSRYIPWMVREDGTQKPIRIFNHTVAEDGSVTTTPHPDVREFYEKAPLSFSSYLTEGGPQSRRGQPFNQKAIALGEHPSQNFGSTLDGKTQCYASLGDAYSRVGRESALPVHTTVEIMEGTSLRIQCSDGFSDVLHDHEIVAIVKQWKEAESDDLDLLVTELWDKMLVEAHKSTMFTFIDGHIKWDDVSLVVIQTSEGVFADKPEVVPEPEPEHEPTPAETLEKEALTRVEELGDVDPTVSAAFVLGYVAGAQAQARA